MTEQNRPNVPPFVPDDAIRARIRTRHMLEYGLALLIGLGLLVLAWRAQPWSDGSRAGLLAVGLVVGLPALVVWSLRRARLSARRLAAVIHSDLFDLDDALQEDIRRYQKGSKSAQSAPIDEQTAQRARAWAIHLSEAFLDALAFDHVGDPWVMAFPFVGDWDWAKHQGRLPLPAWVRNIGGPLLAYLDSNLAAVVDTWAGQQTDVPQVRLPSSSVYLQPSAGDLPAPHVDVRCLRRGVSRKIFEFQIPGLPTALPRQACSGGLFCTCARLYEMNFYLRTFERVRYFILWRPDYPPLQLSNVRLYTQDGVPVLIKKVEVRYRLFGAPDSTSQLETSILKIVRNEPANQEIVSVTALAEQATKDAVLQAFRRVFARYTINNLFSRLSWSVVESYLGELPPELRKLFWERLEVIWETVSLETLRHELLRELNGEKGERGAGGGEFVGKTHLPPIPPPPPSGRWWKASPLPRSCRPRPCNATWRCSSPPRNGSPNGGAPRSFSTACIGTGSCGCGRRFWKIFAWCRNAPWVLGSHPWRHWPTCASCIA